MKMLRSIRPAELLGLILIVGLPLLGSWIRHGPGVRCALDGVAIPPMARVRIVSEVGHSSDFCCIGCAVKWLERHSHSLSTIYVIDETSGQELMVNQATFVRSLVSTNPVTGSRIHAFRALADAEKHAGECRGTILHGSDRPFYNILSPATQPERPR